MEMLTGADIGIDRGGTKIDAIVHLGAIPAPGLVTPSVVFRNNVLSEYNGRLKYGPACRIVDFDATLGLLPLILTFCDGFRSL